MGIPKVLILYTGGTIGMDLSQDPDKKGSALFIPNLSPALLAQRFHEVIPELRTLAECDVDILFNRDSAHVGPDEWILIAKTIQKRWKKYDGIVLLHGTDTLSYTASALSFLLRPCLVPIVITGAQRPLTALRTDARMNLVSAVEIAAHGPKEIVRQVSVFFGDQLFQGNRVRKKSASDFVAFESPHLPPLAVVGTHIRYQTPFIEKRIKRPSKNHLLRPQLSRRVLLAHITPGFPASRFSPSFLKNLDGIVLVAFMSQTAPTHDQEFINFLKRARKLDIPIVIVTEGSDQPLFSPVLPPHYEAGKKLWSEGCLSGKAMTLECAYVKMCLLLGQKPKIKSFAQAWNRKLAEEY